MAFPDDPLDLTVDLLLDGVWTDITPHVYTRDPVSIKRGRTDEGSRVEPSTCSLTLNNTDGRYSPRNPAGPYFGKIGRNTPIRVSVGADVRFLGEVAAWPQRWDKPGKDVWTPVEAAGIMRRLGQGVPPAPSAPRTYILGTDPVAYWPLEDGPLSVHGEPAAGTEPMRLGLNLSPQTWAKGELAEWLPPVIATTTGVAVGLLRAVVSTAAATGWVADWMRSGGVPGNSSTLFTALNAAEETNAVNVGFDTNSDEFYLGTALTAFADVVPQGDLRDDNPHHFRLVVTQDGANIDYEVYADGVLTLSATDTAHEIGVLTFMQLIFGHHTDIRLAAGHVAVWPAGAAPPLADAVAAAFGHQGEPAGRRIERLCAEQGIPFTSVGDLDITTPMGPQGVHPPLDLMAECATADHGILYEPRTTLGLAYRTRASLYNQTPPLDLDYGDGVFFGLPEPVDDDRNTRNDITAKRPASGEARAFLAAGPLSVADPPAGVGVYDTQVTLNVFADGVLPDHASWLLALGTVDEARYPRLRLGLHTPPIASDLVLTAELAALEQGDLIVVTGLPAWLPPDDVPVLALGFTETLAPFTWDIEINTAPATVYTVAEYSSAAGAAGSKYDTDGSQLQAGITTTATTFDVATTRGPLWTGDNAEDGFDIYIGGERMTVTDIVTEASPQTFTVTRSVNGVVKAHPAGATVRLWQPARIAL